MTWRAGTTNEPMRSGKCWQTGNQRRNLVSPVASCRSSRRHHRANTVSSGVDPHLARELVASGAAASPNSSGYMARYAQGEGFPGNSGKLAKSQTLARPPVRKSTERVRAG
jgi:hypothetical protein